jgi:hypothetical protein
MSLAAQIRAASWRRLALAIAAVAYLQLVHALSGSSWQAGDILVRMLFALVLADLALRIPSLSVHGGKLVLPRSWALYVGLFVSCAAVYYWSGRALAAWASLVLFYVLLISASTLCRWSLPGRLLWWVPLVAIGGLIPVVVGQIESRFSDEEFFVALDGLALSGLTALVLSWHYLVRDRLLIGNPSTRPAHGIAVSWRWAIVVVTGLGLLLALLTVDAYQHSFYDRELAGYATVSPEHPFICGQASPDPETPSGTETFARMLRQTEQDSSLTTAEAGMLAVATQERGWAETFRQMLLQEVEEQAFTLPANSVKFGQHEAARRAYYLVRVSASFPSLFSAQEMEEIERWFASINRRAWTVGWVDWLYAAALGDWPKGPYENQENGAGLLALLQTYALGDGALDERNRDYLSRNPRGWIERFRNSDDAYIYQAEWLENALFQSAYWTARGAMGETAVHNQRLSFEWLLLQAVPDGAPLGYNHPGEVSLAQTAYLGAALLDDPRYVWWAARLLDWNETGGLPLYVQPGAEEEVPLVGRSPEEGSCLLYGNAGLPNQSGALAPDKVVFRDGWTPDSRYLLLNLRFSGWHRYKATNTVTLLYDQSPLVVEQYTDQAFTWLPIGRSLFRDKRIPRENLNGLLLPKSGLAAVLYNLTGSGGPWAQDPPHSAQVMAFDTGERVDVSRTLITDWNGWRHDRQVHFYHDGPIIVEDGASGPSAQRAALTWHLGGVVSSEGSRFVLRGEPDPVKVVLLSVDGSGTIRPQPGATEGVTSLLYEASEGGKLGTFTVFLSGEWCDAELGTHTDASGRTTLSVSLAGREISVPFTLTQNEQDAP